MKQGRCKGDIFFAPAEGEIRCAGIQLLNLLPHFYRFHPSSPISPRFRVFRRKTYFLCFEILIIASFSNFGEFWAYKNLWRHVGANLRIFTHIKYQRHQVIRRVTKRPLNQQPSLQMLNDIRIAWISRNWHKLEVFFIFERSFLTNFWCFFEKKCLKSYFFQQKCCSIEMFPE